jgi:hypothetical protein
MEKSPSLHYLDVARADALEGSWALKWVAVWWHRTHSPPINLGDVRADALQGRWFLK